MSLETESDFGVSFILHSDSDTDIFKNNNACAFENVFKKPIQLNLEHAYEISLANIHAPIYQCSLVKNDFEKSFIQYNIGVFEYVDEKWKLHNVIDPIKIWKMAPNKSFMGLDKADTTRNDMEHRRINFIENLSRSLILEDIHPDGEQTKCLRIYKDALDKANKYSFSGKLMGTYDDGLGIFDFDMLAEVNQEDRYDLLQKLLEIYVNFPDGDGNWLKEYLDLIKKEYKQDQGTNINDFFKFNRNDGPSIDEDSDEDSKNEFIFGLFISGESSKPTIYRG